MPMLCPVIYQDNKLLTQFAFLLRHLDVPQRIIYCDSDVEAIGDNVTLVLDVNGKTIGIDSQYDVVLQQQLPQRLESLIAQYAFHSLFFWTSQLTIATEIVSELQKKYRFETGWHIYSQHIQISAVDESKHLLKIWEKNHHTITEYFPIGTESVVIPGLQLPAKFCQELVTQPETGMGYQIATVILNDGRQYRQAVILECHMITSIRGINTVPFSSGDIAQIILTHEKWDFNEK